MGIKPEEVVRIAWAIGIKRELSEEGIKALANSLWLSIYPEKEPWQNCPKNPF